MKTSMTAAAMLATSAAPALAWGGVQSKRFQMQAVTVNGNKPLGHIWTESKEPNFPDPVYGDEAFDVMFRKGEVNNKALDLHDLYGTNGSSVWISCARSSPYPCYGYAWLNVGGGEWEAGHYLVDASFRYDNQGEKGFTIENYDKESGLAEMVYNGPKAPYAFYACGNAPTTEDGEPSGDLVIKYASEETPAECEDVRLQVDIGKNLDDFEIHCDPNYQFSGCC